MQFFHNSNIVKNKKSILNIGNMNKPILRAEHKFQIFVKLIEGKTITLDVRTDYTIEQVMELIYCKSKKHARIPFRSFFDYIVDHFLTFQSKVLSGGFKLIDNNIRKESTLCLSARLLGGGKRARAAAPGEAIPKFIGVPQAKDL